MTNYMKYWDYLKRKRLQLGGYANVAPIQRSYLCESKLGLSLLLGPYKLEICIRKVVICSDPKENKALFIFAATGHLTSHTPIPSSLTLPPRVDMIKYEIM